MEASPLKRPIALAVHSKAGAYDSRFRCADVAERSEALNQQTLDIRQKLCRAAVSFFEFKLTCRTHTSSTPWARQISSKS